MGRTGSASGADMGRRELLRGAARCVLAGLVAPVGLRLLGCADGDDVSSAPASLRLPLAALPVGQRRVVQLGSLPVELQRDGDGVTARSLRCTHMGCTVEWREAEQIYQCPCHEGRFDREGRVILGPPPAPLPTLPVRIEGQEILLGGGGRE